MEDLFWMWKAERFATGESRQQPQPFTSVPEYSRHTARLTDLQTQAQAQNQIWGLYTHKCLHLQAM